ncbi:hypothetical protein HPB47_017724, partial [Ixodes persulcatus]
PEEPSWAVDLSSDSHESPSDVDDVSDIEGSTQSESGNAEEGTRSASFLLDDDGLLQRCLAEFGSATLPHSTTTKAAAVAMLLSIASAHRVTWTLLEHILEFVDMLYGATTHVLPRSKYMFRKLWCSRTSAQLKHVMSKEKKELSENMEKIEVSLSQPEVTDVTSASIYRCLRQDGVIKKGDLTLIINTDGSPLLKSSRSSIWPIQFSISELPPQRRFTSTTLAATRVKTTPQWCRSSAAQLTLPLVTYAGYFGCPWCLIKGKHEGGCIRYAYDEDDQEPAPERTAAMVLRDTDLAEQLRVAVQGVKGPSSLATVPNFDPVWGFTVDYKHCVLLGVTRQVTETLIASSNSAMAFYIEDILAAAPTSNQYDNLKAAILARKTASERSRLQHLLNMEELGDQRPSQLLRRMRQLLGDATSDADTSLLRELFLQRLPNNMVVVLAAAEDMPLERLADLADRVAEYSTPPVVAATSFQSRTSDPAAASPSQDIAARLSRLEKAIQDLQLPASRPSSSRRRSSSRRASPAADHAFWKASEWRHWLLFYVLPCTLDILPPRYWSHLCRLAEAIFLLLLPEINESQIRRAGK